MNSLKNKLGILAVLLCMGAVVLLVWYLLFTMSENGASPDGTLVQSLYGKLVNI